MAIFGKGELKQANLTLELAKAQVKNELYESMIVKFEAQIERLQEALVAATSPKAYEQILADKVEPSKPDPMKEQKAQEDELFRRHLENLEAPTFRDADDLISSLSGMIGVQTGADSMHGNQES